MRHIDIHICSKIEVKKFKSMIPTINVFISRCYQNAEHLIEHDIDRNRSYLKFVDSSRGKQRESL